VPLLLLQADLLAEVSLPIVDACGPVDAFCGWFDVEFKVRLCLCSKAIQSNTESIYTSTALNVYQSLLTKDK
jgi:hypothetical protein